MREDKLDYIDSNEFTFFNELNNFVIKMYSELLTERDEIILKYKSNIELLSEVRLKIVGLENDMSYNENIFSPTYSLEENELKLKNLNYESEGIIRDNRILQERIDVLNNKIDEIDSLINKFKDNNNKEYLKNCNDEYKVEILRSQEFERKRIARDIHDTVIQKLTNLIHKSEFTLKIMDVDIIRAKLELMTISNSLRDVIDEMRNIIYNLRPMAFDDIGIDVIIERELIKIKENGIKVIYEVDGDSCNVDQIIQITLIRIIQEACNNAIKHSNFTELYVKILYNIDSIEVYIRDNGKGFEVPENNNMIFESKSGFGLSMMKERIYLLSGLINFESKKDLGTQIYVKVPRCFKEEKKDAN